MESQSISTAPGGLVLIINQSGKTETNLNTILFIIKNKIIKIFFLSNWGMILFVFLMSLVLISFLMQ